MEQHIDVLPRIIEPSMMASFTPKKDLITPVDVQTCLTPNNTTAPEEAKSIDEPNSSVNENSRLTFFKQNFVIILVMISIMVVIYVFYKFYYYQKNSKTEDTASKPKQVEKKGSADRKNTNIPKESIPISRKTNNTSMDVEDASKYIHLDEEDEEIPEKETHSQKMTVNDIVHEKYDIPTVQVAVQSLSIQEKQIPDQNDRFTYIESDVEQEKEGKKVSFDDTMIDTMIQSKIMQSDSIQPIKMNPQHIERDVDTILKDIKSEEISSNPFILDSFSKIDDTESVKSNETDGSTFSENRNEKLQDIPSEVEEEKKRPKKVSRKVTRPLKIRS